MKTKLRWVFWGMVALLALAALVWGRPNGYYLPDPAPPAHRVLSTKWVGSLAYAEVVALYGRPPLRTMMSYDTVELGLREDGVVVWRPHVPPTRRAVP